MGNVPRLRQREARGLAPTDEGKCCECAEPEGRRAFVHRVPAIIDFRMGPLEKLVLDRMVGPKIHLDYPPAWCNAHQAVP